jgi:microsomal dipeptidase-like Zn-dependent dipeptidase
MAKNFNAVKSKKNKPKCSGYFVTMPKIKPDQKSGNMASRRRLHSKLPSRKRSIWHKNLPTWTDKFSNKILSLTKFTQSDFTTLTEGNVGLVNVCLGPLEKGFVKTRIGSGVFSLLLVSLVTCLPYKRLKYLVRTQSYFRDIEKEKKYFEKLNEKETEIENNGRKKYKLVNKKSELTKFDNSSCPDIQVVFSIEGANIFDKGLVPKIETALRDTVIDNIDRIKKWEYPPLWVSIGHHFYNELCGHAKTLPDIVKILINQKPGINKGITPFGKEVIEKLLEEDANNSLNSILIDIKHMSRKSRKHFYKFCEKYYNSEDPSEWEPIVVSHSACNGWISNRYKDKEGGVNNENIKGIGQNSSEDYKLHKYFRKISANLTDEDIEKVAQSGGIIGIQLDERRLGNKITFKKIKKNIRQKKRLYFNDNNTYNKETLKKYWWSKPVWENIFYIANIINQLKINTGNNDLNPWAIQCIGSDFDGMINPLDCFWTAGNMTELRDSLLYHARIYAKYEKDNGNNIDLANKLFFDKTPEEILDAIMTNNAYNFIESRLKD